MDKKRLLEFFARMDAGLSQPAELLIYGSAAFILLDEEARTSLDLDIAGPYSKVDFEEFRRVSQAAGLAVNPLETTANDHIEWVSSLRLCLAPPEVAGTLTLWQGQRLVIKTVAAADLVASKLIRYDPIDQSDIRYLVTQMRLTHMDVVQAVSRLPEPFSRDALVRENLNNLKEDMALWTSNG